MGEIAEQMMEDAHIAILLTHSEAVKLSDCEICEELDYIIKNKDPQNQYDADEFTHVIKSIIKYYKKYGVISKKQRSVLNKHYAIHGETPEIYY